MAKTQKKQVGLSKEEVSAMKDYLEELNSTKTQGDKAVLEKIGKMSEPDRSMARRIHEVVKAAAPNLIPKLWYGMPAYSNKEGKVMCFFQDAAKFKTRYATFGFSDKAKLDEGNMWATGFAIKKLTTSEEKEIAELVKRALGK